MEVETEKCLVCESQDGPLCSLLDPFPHSDHFETGTKGGKGTTTNVILNQQLSVIFLLRRVLRVETSFLEATLRKTGSNPSAWNLKLCRICYRTFEEADFVFTRLRKLQAEFDELSKSLCRRIVAKSSTDGQEKGGAATRSRKRRPGRRSRRRSRKGEDTEEDPAKESDTEDGLFTVFDCIRRELSKQKDTVQGRNAYKDLNLAFQNQAPTSLSSIKKATLKTEPTSNKNLRVKFNDEKRQSINQDDDLSEGEIPPGGTNYHGKYDDMPELINEGGGSDGDNDIDYAPSPTDGFSDGQEDNSDDEPSDNSDSDFEISTYSERRSKNSKRKAGPSSDGGSNGPIIMKAVKMENANTFTCPQCKEIFESASICDEHILHEHYDGKWPQNLTCHICKDKSFKGEFWLQHHYKMRHPGVKSAIDEKLDQSIGEGRVPELTYTVIPLGETMTFTEEEPVLNEEEEDKKIFNRTVDAPPKNLYSIPVIQGTGQTRYLVLPNCIKKIPKVFSLLEIGPEPKQCGRCDKAFPTMMQLKAHFKRVHEGQNFGYECPLCPKKFERIGKVLIHVQRAHIHSKHICDKCGNTYREEILLNAHLHRDHFGIQYPYKCVVCDIRYPRRNTLNKHLKKVHKLKIASKFLLRPRRKPATATAPAISNPHRPKVKRGRKSKKDKKFPCKTCMENGKFEMRFVSEVDLDVHIKRRHMGIARPYKCTVCDKKYSKPSKVEQHMILHHTVRSDLHIDDSPTVKMPPLPFVCHPCNKQFKTRSLYNVHMRGLKHQDVRPFVCELCSKGFTGLKYLQNHQNLMHHKELNIDPFKCKFCNKVLSSNRTLTDHIKLRHTKTANFNCPHCDVQTQHRSSMDQHINSVHSKVQTFLCPQCPKTFTRDFYLKNHFGRVHSGLQPYECNYCLKKFSDKPTYNRHVEAHSDVVHDCQFCGKSGFKTRHSLRVHLKTFHKTELDEYERQKKLERLAKPEDVTEESASKLEPEVHTDVSQESRNIDEEMNSEDENQLETDQSHNNTKTFTDDFTVNLFL